MHARAEIVLLIGLVLINSCAQITAIKCHVCTMPKIEDCKMGLQDCGDGACTKTSSDDGNIVARACAPSVLSMVMKMDDSCSHDKNTKMTMCTCTTDGCNPAIRFSPTKTVSLMVPLVLAGCIYFNY